MRKLMIFVAVGLYLVSCKDEVANPSCCPTETISYIQFGHFYGECIGEGCVEIFKIEDHRLYEDSLDQYPGSVSAYTGSYVELSSTQYDLVKDLVEFIPDELYDQDTVVGNPDGADWGGIYFEIGRFGNAPLFWLLDQNENNMPAELNEFVDRINEKIALINQ